MQNTTTLSYAHECKTLMCSFINIDADGKSIETGALDPLRMLIVIMGLLMIVLNVAAYVKVSRQSRNMYAQMKDISTEIAEKISKMAPLAIQETKASSRRWIDEGFKATVDAFGPIQAHLMSTEDAKEGPKAFMEKRSANFKGI